MQTTKGKQQQSAIAIRKAAESRLAAAAGQPEHPLAELATLAQAGEVNALAPITQWDRIPKGCSLSLRSVLIDKDLETYPQQGGKRAMLKPALDKIANAAGVTWEDSRKVDTIGHPYFCRWAVSAMMHDPDGTPRRVYAHKAIDLRDDNGAGEQGARLQQLLADAKKSALNGNSAQDKAAAKTPDGLRKLAEKRIRAEREHIESYAESKACNRAIRRILALRQSYPPDVFKLPFATVKLVPNPDDPASAAAIVGSLMQARQALYDPPAASPPHPAALLNQDQEELDPDTVVIETEDLFADNADDQEEDEEEETAAPTVISLHDGSEYAIAESVLSAAERTLGPRARFTALRLHGGEVFAKNTDFIRRCQEVVGKKNLQPQDLTHDHCDSIAAMLGEMLAAV